MAPYNYNYQDYYAAQNPQQTRFPYSTYANETRGVQATTNVNTTYPTSNISQPNYSYDNQPQRTYSPAGNSSNRAAEALQNLSNAARTNILSSRANNNSSPLPSVNSRGSMPDNQTTQYSQAYRAESQRSSVPSYPAIDSGTANTTSASGSLQYPTSQPPLSSDYPPRRPQDTNIAGGHESSAQSSMFYGTESYSSSTSTAAQDPPSYTRTSSSLYNSQPTVSYDSRLNSYKNGSVSTVGKDYTVYDQPSVTTVDPTQVYDPWDQIQRKQGIVAAAARAVRGISGNNDSERVTETLPQPGVAVTTNANSLLPQAPETPATSTMTKSAANAPEANLTIRGDHKSTDLAKGDQRPKEKKSRGKKASKTDATISDKPEKPVKSKKPTHGAKATAKTGSAISDDDPEAKSRALMAQMRELKATNPALLSKFLEEENLAQPGTSDVASDATGLSLSLSNALPTAKKPANQPSSRTTAHASTVPSASASVPKTESKKGQTIWPATERGKLGTAAASWLNRLTVNATNHITPDEICACLDGNPSYIELCEFLEGRGLKFDRAAFARSILAAVPSLNSNKAQVKGSTPSRPIQSPGIRVVEPVLTEPADRGLSQVFNVADHHIQHNISHPAPSGITHSNNNDQTVISQGDELFPLIDPALTGNDPRVLNPPEQLVMEARAETDVTRTNTSKEDKPDPELLKPVTKEQASRKRTFAELVDLTALSDDEPVVVETTKRLHIEDPAMPLDGTSSHLGNHAPETWPPTDSFLPHVTTPSLHTDYQGRIHNSYPHAPGSPAGHPDGSATNHRIHYHSHPHQAPLPQAARGDVAVNNAMYSLEVVKPIDRKKAMRRSTYNASTIARDVLLATGRHPEMRPLNAHLEVLRKNFRSITGNPDLGTFRWDLVDPGEPPRHAMTGNFNDGVEADDEQSDGEDDGHRQDNDASAARATMTYPAYFQPLPPASLASTTKPGQKRRGRPPKHSYPDYNSVPSNVNITPVQRKAYASLPMSSQQPEVVRTVTPAGASGYTGFRQFGPGGSVIKKKGRPVGWRKAIHGSEAAKAKTPGKSPQVNPKPPGDRIEKPHYYIYKCKWVGCKAQLHNLDTLRKHIYKVHVKQQPDGSFDCEWESCGANEQQDAQAKQRTRYPNELSWRTHVELKHLGPVAWKLGDGPSSGHSDTHESASEAYLSDSHGRRVTPYVTAPEPSNRDAHHPTMQVPRGRGRPKQKTLEGEAKAAQRALEMKKKLIGPGLDRGGCTLATEKRRMGLLDDEDFEDIVDVE